MEKPDFMPCNTESDIQQTIFNSLTAFKDANTEEELIEKMDVSSYALYYIHCSEYLRVIFILVFLL